jgi:hypothetical protein
MGACEAFAGVEIESMNEAECVFLLDVLESLASGPAALSAATARSARELLGAVRDRLFCLEAAGLVGHESPIRSGHVVPEFSLKEEGGRSC